MTTVLEDVQSRFADYLLLNGSFTNNIGAGKGKSALILYFYHLFGDSDEVFSLLEEVNDQAVATSDVSFGNGLAGFGTVLEHLVQMGIIDLDTNDLLEECDKNIESLIFTNKTWEVSLSDGISGIGLYLLHRLGNNAPHNNMLFFKHRIKDNILRCIFLIELAFVAYQTDSVPLPEFTGIWNSPAGALLFLAAARRSLPPDPKLDLIIGNISNFILNRLQAVEFKWGHISSWYILLYSAVMLPAGKMINNILPAFKKILQKMPSGIQKLDLQEAAFSALLLRLIYRQFSLAPALHLSDEILKRVDRSIKDNVLPAIFPYQDKVRSVQLGLNAGVCGTSLSLWSIVNNNYQWLLILGIDANINSNNSSKKNL